ncbi:MAG: hypothetical protein ABH882_05340 [Candidatus Omnitrophota bacterium]|nr:hypothetical protein [Candidatus Omnitrophota bacterium]MBU1928781.1 hypothetical protein [Candidatus Omnitrophota bacterium]MBU2034240.1 hypothetical protein [Candidatus Omnitrophota bacterium]
MCYAAPTTAAIITTFIWSSRKTVELFWLMLLFYGGALFGIIDHLWNGELFLISENWVKDFSLGIIITVSIILVWKGLLLFAKKIPQLNSYLSITVPKQ